MPRSTPLQRNDGLKTDRMRSARGAVSDRVEHPLTQLRVGLGCASPTLLNQPSPRLPPLAGRGKGEGLLFLRCDLTENRFYCRHSVSSFGRRYSIPWICLGRAMHRPHWVINAGAKVFANLDLPCAEAITFPLLRPRRATELHSTRGFPCALRRWRLLGSRCSVGLSC
jgi:hypothetical protein